MQTIRRLYFYIISFLSLEVLLWGLVILLRTLLDTLPAARSLQPLAEGLAMVCTGIPIFGLHWYFTQRRARSDSEEVNSRLRDIIGRAFQQVHQVHTREQVPMRLAALSLGVRKVAEAKTIRGLFP